MIRVFISHKNVDEREARSVASRVTANGLDVYLDSIDPALGKTGDDLAEYLLSRMGECQQLIAVVSVVTRTSWWVPWEIGVGSEKGFGMATYSESPVSLPDYLKKWPSLHSLGDIDKYCTHSKRRGDRVGRDVRTYYTESVRLQMRKSASSKFHTDLMAALRTRSS